MFQGETAIKVDDKGRMTIPTALRPQIESACQNRLVLTYDVFESGCLVLYPQAEYEKVKEKVNKLPQAKRANRFMRRRVVGSAELIEVDGNFRISLPAMMRKTVKLQKDAVLIGMGNKLELWSESAYLEQARVVIDEDDITEEMLDIEF